MSERNIAAVVLAAGASTRLGKPKQLAVMGGETLLERAVRTAREAGCVPIVVVLGASYLEVLAGTYGTLGDAIPVINDKWQKGMATSIGLGVRTLALVAKSADGVVLMTCDQPAVTASHLRELCAEPELIAGSGYAGKIGIPAYFPCSRFDELMKLSGDTGARALLRGARTVNSEELALDIDTEDDLKRARELFG